uniref:En-A4 pheromone n=1 Tax=Euplotes nobilii TaxID=184062 RepID=C4NXD8_EUPNO|nr:En-A4 pheromone precursor [Euplotes nobilii]
MTKLSIFVVIAMLVMVSSAFRFQSRMKAKTETATRAFKGYSEPGCPYNDGFEASNACIAQCSQPCCASCFNGEDLIYCNIATGPGC